MRKHTYIEIVFTLLTSLFLAGCHAESLSVKELRGDFISNLGEGPIFSWTLTDQSKGVTQTGYQIVVSDHLDKMGRSKPFLWNSKKQTSISSHQVVYTGPDLEQGKRYFARVRAWDHQDQVGPWSEAVCFTVPLNYPENWKSQWLTYDYQEDAPLPIFRKAFALAEPAQIDYVRFYIAAPGYYEAFLNGEKIGENVLDPGQTNYEDYTYYTVYDVEPGNLRGDCVLGVMLGNGWYNQNQVWRAPGKPSPMVYGQPVFTCQLVVHYQDGSKKVIASDETWQWAPGPITYANVYGGEHYDARRELKNWNRPGEVAGQWFAARKPEVHPSQLYQQFAEPIRIMDEITPKQITTREDGTYMVDMGQNMAGWLELKIDGEPGQEITIQCTEVLDEKGDLDPRSTGIQATKVIQTLKYTCHGQGIEIWQPRFTYFGFRYAQVTGLRKQPDKNFLTGKVVYSSVKEAGEFQCSEININKLHTLSRWSIMGNIHSIPTDCPHREKCGWTGDSHAMILPMIYNWDSERFFQKYMFDMRSSARLERKELYFGAHFLDRSIIKKPKGIPTMIVPGKRTSGIASPDWGTAMVQIPWILYVYYGDRVMLKSFYPDMKVWVDYIEGIKADGIIPHGLGDWCPLGGNANKACPVPISSSAFHILDVSIMAQAAKLLGEQEDHLRYTTLLTHLKADFNRHFFDPQTQSYGSSQTANILALDMDIVPEELKTEVAGAILKNRREAYNGFLNTGIFGLARVFQVLAENGYEDEVYRLLTKTGKNSFAHMWDQHDATTLWESLPTGEHSRTGSMNHPMQAGFDAWFYSGIAGINPSSEDPGFQRIVFKPYLTRQLDSASAQYDSRYGLIRSAWQREDKAMTWRIRIPSNSQGQIWVPTYGNAVTIRINGKPASVIEQDSGFSLIGTYKSGDYRVQW